MITQSYLLRDHKDLFNSTVVLYYCEKMILFYLLITQSEDFYKEQESDYYENISLTYFDIPVQHFRV